MAAEIVPRRPGRTACTCGVMPAEGAMQTEAEAPVTGPPYVQGVELEGVSKAFGPVQALARVDLRAAAGEVVAVAGPSGCGKSTLLEIVCGLLPADAGR